VRAVRVVAVGLRFDPARVVDRATFVRSLETTLDRIEPADGDTPMLVAFPEHTGLLVMLTGARGAAARDVLASGGDSLAALTALAVAYGDQLGHYAGVFPEADSPGQLLHLALTDTVVDLLLGSFAMLARTRGLWVTVGAALADWERTTGELAATLGDPDADRRHAFVATAPVVRNRNLVFGPDGELATIQDKAYLVPIERDRGSGLGLDAVAVDGIRVADLPVGRLGSVISKDAWMVDVNDRLDQLGAQLLVQPEAFDRWSEADRGPGADGGEVLDLWPPDKFQRGGWWMVQRHPSLRGNVTPVLLGALGELRFDGQPLVAVPAPGGDPVLGLLGQPRDVGWAAVGAWWRDPGPSSALAEPDARARFAAAPATPDAGTEPRDVLAVAHLSLPWQPVWSPSPSRPPELRASVEVVPDGTLLVPDLAVDDGGPVLAAIAADGQGRQEVVVTRWTTAGWLPAEPIAPPVEGSVSVFDRRWRPRLVAAEGGLACLYLGFPAESWDLFASTHADGAWSSPVRVDDAHRDRGVLRERGHDAAVVVRHGGELIAVWSDLRWPWVLPQVRSARSRDGGRRWSSSGRVDGRPQEGQPDPLAGRHPAESRGQTAPALASTAEGPVVAWQERAPGGGPTTWVAVAPVVDVAGGGTGGWSAPRRLDGDDGPSRWRPTLAAAGHTCWLVDEVAVDERGDEGGSRLEVRVSTDAGRSWGTPRPVDPTRPVGVRQRRAAVVAIEPSTAVVVFEDDRAGSGRVHAVVLGADGPVAEVCRIDDAPEGADARSPTVVRCGPALLVAWQDTRAPDERIRSLELPLRALLAATPDGGCV
jgi:predicted amidohydrolase